MYSPYRCPKCRYSSYDLSRVTRHIERCVHGKKGPLVPMGEGGRSGSEKS